MTRDPREDKLPRWAQDLLAAERERAALAWPTFREPEPLFRASGDFAAPPEARGRAVYTIFRGNFSRFEVRGWGVDPDGYMGSGVSRFRPRGGPYYATHDDALRAAHWAACRAAAKEILAITEKFAAAEQPGAQEDAA